MLGKRIGASPIIRLSQLFLGFLFAAILFVTTSVLIAWTGPTAVPPEDNVSPPINTGVTNQVKDGGLSVNALAVFGNAIISGASRYLNFGTIPGEAGYGIRDNGGIVEFKDHNGTWMSPLSASTTRGGITYAIAGQHLFTVPAGVTSIKVTAVGSGGGGGGGRTSCCACGGAGGSGSVAIGWATGLTPGKTVIVQVGDGGSGGSGGKNGSAGTASSFGTYVVAGGGGGGINGNSSRAGGAGGAATGSGLAWGMRGVNGGTGTSGSGCTPQSARSSRGPFTNTYGLPYGGSGGGGASGGSGSSGENGFVFLEW
jgi:hypothetical protein